jgi:hypothetical protein
MRRLAQVEFFHHLHYFLYVYVFWSRLRDLPLPALGALFTIGWAAYFVAETILRERRRLFSPAAIAAGHLLCAASIAGMLCTRQLAVSMVLWFLTGLGGGTAYMLGNGPQHPDRERYEDSGHVAGALVAGLAAGLVSAELALGLAVVAALLTALLALSIQTIRKDTPCQ